MILASAKGMMTLVGVLGLEKIAFGKNSIISTPALTEGPYWVDETGSAFYRSDVRANLNGANVQTGLPLYLGLTVSQVSNGVVSALPNAFIYVWSANASGLYSDEAALNTASDTFLRGYQVSNANGGVQFITLYPGWYSGRTAHIHVRVRLYPNNDPTKTPTYDFETQLFFDQALTNEIYARVSPYSKRPTPDTTNSKDSIYLGGSLDADGVTSGAGAYTTVTAADDMTYAVGAFQLVLDLSLTEPTGSGGGSTGGSGGGTGGGTGGSGGGTGGRPGGSGPGGGGTGGRRP